MACSPVPKVGGAAAPSAPPVPTPMVWPHCNDCLTGRGRCHSRKSPSWSSLPRQTSCGYHRVESWKYPRRLVKIVSNCTKPRLSSCKSLGSRRDGIGLRDGLPHSARLAWFSCWSGLLHWAKKRHLGVFCMAAGGALEVGFGVLRATLWATFWITGFYWITGTSLVLYMQKSPKNGLLFATQCWPVLPSCGVTLFRCGFSEETFPVGGVMSGSVGWRCTSAQTYRWSLALLVDPDHGRLWCCTRPANAFNRPTVVVWWRRADITDLCRLSTRQAALPWPCVTAFALATDALWSLGSTRVSENCVTSLFF